MNCYKCPQENEVALVQQLTRHKGPVRGLEFSCLSPNHLASGAEEGEICIWDISKPSEPTHFSPLKIWDMRNTMSPLREVVGHNKAPICLPVLKIIAPFVGTLVLARSVNLSVNFNNFTSLKSYAFFYLIKIVSELPAGTNWNFDVHRYPKIPGIISASSFDGKVGIYNIDRIIAKGEEATAELDDKIKKFTQDTMWLNLK
ncbi:hypothetical protein L1887_17756 [Cichorium endivia]|nr:hypothetical protein L1887_17756 [Cichorium endivia]